MCPNCQHPRSRIYETRQTIDGLFRRRKCAACANTYWTQEAPIDGRPTKLKLLAEQLRESTQPPAPTPTPKPFYQFQ